jgi:hypothetical protein
VVREVTASPGDLEAFVEVGRGLGKYHHRNSARVPGEDKGSTCVLTFCKTSPKLNVTSQIPQPDFLLLPWIYSTIASTADSSEVDGFWRVWRRTAVSFVVGMVGSGSLNQVMGFGEVRLIPRFRSKVAGLLASCTNPAVS